MSVQFIEFFNRHRAAGTPLVLVTVVETNGSTYSKAGHRTLIDVEGHYHGLVSGGCLEGDLIEHSRRVFADGLARMVVYDLRDEREDLWGLGIGCNGLIKLLLQLAVPADNYEPLTTLVAALQGEQRLELDLVVATMHPRIPLGATLIRKDNGSTVASLGIDETVAKSIDSLTCIDDRGSVIRMAGRIDDHAVECLRQSLLPLPRVLILGAGPDALPLVAGFRELGWRIAIADHRSAYLNRPEFGAIARHLVEDEVALRSLMGSAPPSAVIVMSHNLQADERALRVLANCRDVPYVGLLGPAHRREKLLKNLEPTAASRLRSRMHSPIGWDIGADSPAAIALSIVAEVYVELRRTTSLCGTRGQSADEDVSRAQLVDVTISAI
jgi:xanthine dehydrogenase accessory factor